MATFLLVPGAWAGGWVWREVATILRAHDHEVFTPTLTGLGERAHLAHPDIDLDLHIQDILGVMRYEQLVRVILVGWSYGGMVITGVAERASERVAQLIYVDGFVPQDGESGLDVVGPDFAQWLTERAQTLGDGWRIPHDPPDADRRTDHPFKTVVQPITITNPAAATIPRTYIRCTQTDFANLPQNAARAQAAGWRYRELDTWHEPMWTMPEALAALLREDVS
jgi:pimeloyl-ACP methyl ester carboxylesterase